jgi:predicted transglutaminase-like cysteine proteinase
MIRRSDLRKLGSSAFLASLILSAGICAAHAGDGVVAASTSAARREIMRPPATFFSINDVLAKLDRERGRGPNAVRLAALSPSNLATDAQSPQKEAPPLGKEPFGLFTFRAPEGVLWRKWRGIEADLAKEQDVLDRCRTDAGSCPSYAAQFLRLINTVRSKSDRAMLDEANRGVNLAIRYLNDSSHHGEADRWSAPLATFAAAKGDCEDYAIAKYVALREAGFPHENLRVVLVRDRAVRQDHAVLAARLDDRWMILDNRRLDLIADADVSSFTPLFAINHRGVHLFATPYANRLMPASETEAAPAAESEGEFEKWGDGDLFGSFNSLPLPM